MRTWSGVERMRIDVSSELRQDDLPAPVAPAMRMWGMVGEVGEHRLAVDVAPDGDLERVGGLAGLRRWRGCRPRVTSCLRTLGISTPIACLPGMGARMRTSGVAIA